MQKSEKNERVVLDFGHGGSKQGAVYGQIEEKELNLLTGMALYQALHKENDDIQVLLTRDNDYDIPLIVRGELINSHHVKIPIDLCVSIHYNAATNINWSGLLIFYEKGNQKARKLGQLIINEIRKTSIPIQNSGLMTTADLGKDLYMIHKIKPTPILIEVGYITNELDRSNATNPHFREKLGRGIAKGIRQYLKEEVNE
jgi:N-acetylmuramoyl-L-alanine amidase